MGSASQASTKPLPLTNLTSSNAQQRDLDDYALALISAVYILGTGQWAYEYLEQP